MSDGWVRYKEPIAVEVEHEGAWWPGFVLAEGERITVRFTTSPGMTYQQAVEQERVRARA